MPNKNKTPEEDLQRTVAEYLDIIAKMRGWWWSHIAHGGKRTKAEGGIFKAMGLKPGIADILIIDGGRHRTWVNWIELKAPGNDQSPNQVKFQAAMEARGCNYRVCRSLDEVIGTLKAWGLV